MNSTIAILGLGVLGLVGYYVYNKYFNLHKTWIVRKYESDNNEIPPRYRTKRMLIDGMFKEVILKDKDGKPQIIENSKGLHRLRLVGHDKIILQKSTDGKIYYYLVGEKYYMTPPEYPTVEFEKDKDYVDLIYKDGHWMYMTKAVSKTNLNKVDVMAYDTLQMRDTNITRINQQYGDKAGWWDRWGTAVMGIGMGIILLVGLNMAYQHDNDARKTYVEEAKVDRATFLSVVKGYTGVGEDVTASGELITDPNENEKAKQEIINKVKEKE